MAPDGELSSLPLEVLPTDEPDGRLIDCYTISYLNTGRDILRFGISNGNLSLDPLVAVDPDFDLACSNNYVSNTRPSQTEINKGSNRLDRDYIHFRRLSNTQIEGEIIADMLGVRNWSGPEVLKSRIKAYKRRQYYI